MADTKIFLPSEPRATDFVALPLGTVVGRYTIRMVLGQGGFGITYLARDDQLGRDIAIKEYLPTAFAVRRDGITVLPNSTKSADEFTWGRQRFVEEGRTLASLQQAPGIVRVYDFLEGNGTAYIVMELVRGITLEQKLREQGRLSPAEVERIMRPLLEGLAKVHEAGFVHRDIKPANILLDAEGRPVLVDFGAARAAVVGRTAAMTAIFTPGYAAVEQFTDARQGPWTDIYGLSATLYHSISGKMPPSSIDRMIEDTYEPLAKLKPPGFAINLLAGIDRGLGIRAADRPQSIADWQLTLTSDAPPGDGPKATLPTGRRTRAGLYTVGLAALIVAVATGLYVARGSGPAPQSAAVPDLKVEQLERMLAERRKSEAAAAEKLRGEEARNKLAQEAADKEAADAAQAKREAEQRQAEQEAAGKAAAEQRQADEASAKASADRQRVEEEARQKADSEAAIKDRAEEDAKKNADQESIRRQAEEETNRKIEAELAAKEKADEETRQKAAVDAPAKRDAETEDAAKAKAGLEMERKAAEATEAALRFAQVDRQRLQVALTSLGFDTHGNDGVLGPQSREMVAAWQKARNLPSTGFLNAAQQQMLLKEAASAVKKYDEEQSKIASAFNGKWVGTVGVWQVILQVAGAKGDLELTDCQDGAKRRFNIEIGKDGKIDAWIGGAGGVARRHLVSQLPRFSIPTGEGRCRGGESTLSRQ